MEATHFFSIAAMVFGVFGLFAGFSEVLQRSISRGVSRSMRWIGLVGYAFPGLIFGLIIFDRAKAVFRIIGVLGAVGFIVTGLLVFSRSGARSDKSDDSAQPPSS